MKSGLPEELPLNDCWYKALMAMLMIFAFLMSVKIFLIIFNLPHSFPKTTEEQNCTKDMVEKTVRKMVKPEYLIGE